MKIKTLIVWGLIFMSLLNATELEREYEAIIKQKVSACQKITSLDGLYAIAKNEPKLGAKILLSIGKIAIKMEVSLEAYQKEPQMKRICHLKVVKSANYGDFVAYNGHHFRELIQKFPNSDLVDDASYYLLYISKDVNNYDDLNEEKQKLEGFIQKYPNSNLAPKAKERIEFISNHIKNGGEVILD